ncbi:MAG: hypothetical protein E6R05_04020, partial [Candidatus Moraniibacteriota bacterium]
MTKLGRGIDTYFSMLRASRANTKQVDYDEQERLLRGEESGGVSLFRKTVQILGLLGLTYAVLGVADKVSALAISNFANGGSDREGGASRLLEVDELKQLGLDVSDRGGSEVAPDDVTIAASVQSGKDVTFFPADPSFKDNGIYPPYFGENAGLGKVSSVGPLPLDYPNREAVLNTIGDEVMAAAFLAGVPVAPFQNFKESLAVINIHREGPQLAREQWRPFNDMDGQVVVFPAKNGSWYIASRYGGDYGSVAMVPGYGGDWNVNVLKEEMVVVGEAGSGTVDTVFSALGTGSSGVAEVMRVREVDGVATLFLVIPDTNGVRQEYALTTVQADDEFIRASGGGKLASLIAIHNGGTDVIDSDKSSTPRLIEGGMSVEQLTPYIFSKDLLDHPEKIAKMSFEQLNSEEFVKGVLNMLQEGKLPVPPDTAVPMHHVVLGNPLDIDGSGVGGYFCPDSPSSYIDSKHLPYVPSLLIETEIQGVRAYLGILVFLNSDKSYGLFGDVILPRSKVGLVDMLKSSLTLNADGRY